ncbi:AAA family ATPase, partial [Campylobacter coli]|nr:AAA family ATPase [Campylobacter coli]
GNYFSTNSLKSIDEIFYENPDSNKILNYHVDKWIKEILDLEISFTTNESIDIILNGFKDKNFSNYFLPSNISTGLNFAKIIIIGLSLKKGDIFIIENPEIHLHPKAISKFADFFAFLVSKGIQVIIETHSNYLLSKLRYINFKKEFKDEDCIIYYK